MEPLRYGIASQKISMTSLFQRRPRVMLCTARDANVFLLLVMILFLHVATSLLSNLAAAHILKTGQTRVRFLTICAFQCSRACRSERFVLNCFENFLSWRKMEKKK